MYTIVFINKKSAGKKVFSILNKLNICNKLASLKILKILKDVSDSLESLSLNLTTVEWTLLWLTAIN